MRIPVLWKPGTTPEYLTVYVRVTTAGDSVLIQPLVPLYDQKPAQLSSSTPPIISEEQAKLFRGVLELMNREGVPYVVSGAFALREHTGIYRDTKDLDLFVPGDRVLEALRALTREGFQTEVCDPVWLAKAHSGEYYVDLITGMSNAAIVVDQSWVDRGSPAEVIGVPCRVLAAEELFASKLFVTRRERFDGADTVHIIYATRGRMDWNRILQLAGEHWEVVLWTLVLFRYCYPANSDYVPRKVWDGLLGRFQRAIRRPQSSIVFRGSLIDEFMFAIDVNEWGLPDLLNVYREQREPKIPEDAGMGEVCALPDESEPAA